MSEHFVNRVLLWGNISLITYQLGYLVVIPRNIPFSVYNSVRPRLYTATPHQVAAVPDVR